MRNLHLTIHRSIKNVLNYTYMNAPQGTCAWAKRYASFDAPITLTEN